MKERKKTAEVKARNSTIVLELILFAIAIFAMFTNTNKPRLYDGIAITPRNGKVVEVNSLWYNANQIMAELSKRFKHPILSKKYKELAQN